MAVKSLCEHDVATSNKRHKWWKNVLQTLISAGGLHLFGQLPRRYQLHCDKLIDGKLQETRDLHLHLTFSEESPGTFSSHVSDPPLVEPWNDSSSCQNLNCSLESLAACLELQSSSSTTHRVLAHSNCDTTIVYCIKMLSFKRLLMEIKPNTFTYC